MATPPNQNRPKGVRKDVHISIGFTGLFPVPSLIAKRDDLEMRLTADKAGTAVRKTSRKGFLDMWVVTADPDRTIEVAWQHVNALGLGSRTTIHAEVIDPRRSA